MLYNVAGTITGRGEGADDSGSTGKEGVVTVTTRQQRWKRRMQPGNGVDGLVQTAQMVALNNSALRTGTSQWAQAE